MRVVDTMGVVVLLALCLTGCIAYDAASTVVDAGASVVGTAVDVTGDAAGMMVGSSSHKSQH